MKEKLFLLDAYALIFRSYYAFMQRPMRNREGMNTSAVFGFTKFLRDILKTERPHYLGVAFDPKGGNFRNQLYPEYKANRSETPEDIIASVPYIKRVLDAMRIPILEVPGYEADDVIGTLSHRAAAHGFTVYMVTPDKDFGQLVTPDVLIYRQSRTGEGVEIVDRAHIKEKYGVDDPRLIIDILALWGDASDNIPGVRGVGEKGAIKLVNQFGPVENMLSHTDQLTGKLRENVEASREQIMLSKKLATIEMEVPIPFEPEALRTEAPDCEALREVFRELDFSSFLREMDQGGTALSEHMKPTSCVPGLPAGEPAPAVSAGTAASGASATASGTAAKTHSGPPDLFSQGMVPAGAGAADDEAPQHEGTVYKTAATTPHTYHTVRTRAELENLIATLGAQDEFCFDTETTGLDPLSDKMVGMSFCIKAHEAWYVALDNSNREEFCGLLKPLFENEKIAKTGQNLKFDIGMLRGAGITVRGRLYDTMILHYLLEPDARHGMDTLSMQYLDYAPIAIETLIGRGAKQLTMDRVAVDVVAEYAAEDADVTQQLKELLWPQVVGQGFGKLYQDIEEPLISVLSDMELTGVKLDVGVLSAAGKELNTELAELEKQIREAAGEPALNINSPRQLGQVLFEKLKVDPKPKQTKTKQYRTDEDTLQALSGNHPIIGMILEYRGVKKLLSTYVEALPALVNPRDERVHTSYNQTVAATGRLSSTGPTLHKIPIRDERGREIRRAFVPSDADHVLLSADYSQVELRLMAHLSCDEALISAFRHGEDIHAATAARLYGVPIADVT
ncbi:MAG: DNA polymerase I, partial [Rikenellaceae bacterium]|nr:DNA polymerase I [Rikenellaceae bacterium]